MISSSKSPKFHLSLVNDDGQEILSVDLTGKQGEQTFTTKDGNLAVVLFLAQVLDVKKQA